MKNLHKKLAISAFSTLAFLGFFSTPVRAVSFVVDQRNDNFEPGLFNNIEFFTPIGQEFVPRFNSLNVVELYTDDFGGTNGLGASLFTNIRFDTIVGTIVGTSSLVTLPDNFEGITQFNFPSFVSLNPNQRYVIEVRVASGDVWAVASSGGPNSTYPDGRWIIQGQPRENNDLWFREGTTVQVREPISNIGFLTLGTLGAVSVLKTKLKISKFSEKKQKLAKLT